MAPLANTKRPLNFLKPNRNPVKLTALLYLRDALRAERYEDCAEIIAIALEFGALPQEIQYLLEDTRRRPNA